VQELAQKGKIKSLSSHDFSKMMGELFIEKNKVNLHRLSLSLFLQEYTQ
jgi:uncharacterized Rmd1/YagE family protein